MTISITLTRGYVATVDDIDADLAQFRWTPVKYPTNNNVYVMRTPWIKGKGSDKSIKLHRLILERMVGRPLLVTELCDHKDGNSLNNARSNLRIASAATNVLNTKRQCNNTSGFKGVTFNKQAKKWRSNIGFNHKRFHLGYFDTPEEAHAAYCEAGRKYFGEFFNPGDNS